MLQAELALQAPLKFETSLDPQSFLSSSPKNLFRAVSSDAETDSYIRGTAATLFHPCGTCRMGSDANAVVDEDLRFRGIEGLRIADASVMPAVVGGNINACVMMIAEKAAELIAAT